MDFPKNPLRLGLVTESAKPIQKPTGPRLLLIDGHAYAYRAFHAIRSLNSPSGRPTNAIYGFIKMLQKIEAILQPTHRAIIWDAGLAEERMAIQPAYKANRAPTPEPLEEQFPQIQSWAEAAGWFT